MKVHAMLSIVPIGAGVSLSGYIAACQQVLRESGLQTELHAHGTNIEGEWDEVMAAIRRCIETVHSMGAARISTLIKLGTRTDREQSMDEMVRSVRKKVESTEP